jgi:catechol 2,3-dioxygenase-like lactoylglutathione lyase family enzyme
MATTLTTISFLIRDYDEAIAWFTKALGFQLLEDLDQGEGKRWVVVAPPSGKGAKLLLALASNTEQAKAIGNAAGGRVAFFLHTDSFDNDHAQMLAAGVRFRETPRSEAYGKVAVFEDLYGNGWDLIGPAI